MTVVRKWWCSADAVMEARQFASQRCAELRRFTLAVCDGVAVVAVAAAEMVKLRWRCTGGPRWLLLRGTWRSA